MLRPLVTLSAALSATILGLSAPVTDPGGTGTSCVGLDRPVPGRVIEPYAPVGRYAGHWGIDMAAPPGTRVRASAEGTVTFAGSVAHNLTVTLDHGGGLKTSYSYLSELTVRRGASVTRGAGLGSTGRAHDSDGLHFSVRVDGTYVDPMQYLGCKARGPAGGVYLVPPPSAAAYAPRRATRHPGRDVRPAASSSSDGRRGGLPAARTRCDHAASGGSALAEGRPAGFSACASLGDDQSVRRWG